MRDIQHAHRKATAYRCRFFCSACSHNNSKTTRMYYACSRAIWDGMIDGNWLLSCIDISLRAYWYFSCLNHFAALPERHTTAEFEVYLPRPARYDCCVAHYWIAYRCPLALIAALNTLFIYLLTICNKTLKTYFSIVEIHAIGGLQEWSLPLLTAIHYGKCKGETDRDS